MDGEVSFKIIVYSCLCYVSNANFFLIYTIKIFSNEPIRSTENIPHEFIGVS